MRNRKLPRLSRGWKIVLNFTMAAVIFVLFWGVLDYPLNDKVRDFRRAERMDWTGPSEIQLIGENNFDIVGTYLDQVVIQTGRYHLDYWPRDPEGPTLIPMGQKRFGAVDVPGDTVWAELTMHLSFYYAPSLSEQSHTEPTYAVLERAKRECEENFVLWTDTYTVRSERSKEGGVLFRVEPKAPYIPEEMGQWDGLPLYEVSDRGIYSQDPWDNSAWAELEAVFYDESGGELGRAVLSTPDAAA